MKCSGPSFRLIVVRMREGVKRTDDGMMEKPSGSGPIYETKLPRSAAILGSDAEHAAFAAVFLGCGDERR